MSKVFRRILAFVLTIGLLLPSGISAFAASQEEYICELRLIYAADYNQAKAILNGSEFKDYRLLNKNLNADTNKIGVWLAYKATTNIEDAITDLSVMQMQGGYQEGNYQQMIKESLNEYVEMGKTYMRAIDYFVEAYDSGSFMAEAAYRQLNLYTLITDPRLGIKIPSYDGQKLGDIFYESIDEVGLATMFMEGNSHALNSIRSLLAMGVSYNEDGMSYLQKVAEAAQTMIADPQAYANKDFDSVLPIISATIAGFQNSFKELAAHEGDLNYEDTAFTEEELAFMESYAVAKMMQDVSYLDGKTLYDFCLGYNANSKDYSTLLPLAAALNEGQLAMTQVVHYQDVIRYSVPAVAEEQIDAEITKLEEMYKDRLFNVYTGVDRSVYTGTFALTNAAYRADAYTDTESLLDSLFGDQLALTFTSMGLDVVGFGILAGGAYHYQKYDLPAYTDALSKETSIMLDHHSQLLGQNTINVVNNGVTTSYTYDQLLTDCLTKYHLGKNEIASMSVFQKYTYVLEELSTESREMFLSIGDIPQVPSKVLTQGELDAVKTVCDKLHSAGDYLGQKAHLVSREEIIQRAVDKVGSAVSTTTVLIWIGGGIVMLSSAILRGIAIYNYYHPDYDDIPVAMVDVINTVDGDRYIKYDAVLEAEPKTEGDKKGTYVPGDLNAFQAQRWNALYYTKSYEAGMPLLADEFVLSNNNNKPNEGYTPVHRFGEVICYDLNKYNFKHNTGIYLSVKQSKNNKAAVADVPKVVGSIFSDGLWLLVGGVGSVVGVGGTLGTQMFLKKKNGKKTQEDAQQTTK